VRSGHCTTSTTTTPTTTHRQHPHSHHHPPPAPPRPPPTTNRHNHHRAATTTTATTAPITPAASYTGTTRSPKGHGGHSPFVSVQHLLRVMRHLQLAASTSQQSPSATTRPILHSRTHAHGDDNDEGGGRGRAILMRACWSVCCIGSEMLARDGCSKRVHGCVTQTAGTTIHAYSDGDLREICNLHEQEQHEAVAHG
jgi:hypothetical protein